jgi:hypothetical protein
MGPRDGSRGDADAALHGQPPRTDGVESGWIHHGHAILVSVDEHRGGRRGRILWKTY